MVFYSKKEKKKRGLLETSDLFTLFLISMKILSKTYKLNQNANEIIRTSCQKKLIKIYIIVYTNNR